MKTLFLILGLAAVSFATPCDICDKAVSELATLINEKWMQENLKVFLTKACTLIPEQKYADSCVQTVNNDIDKITKFIGSKVLNPDNCKKIFHCDFLHDFSICEALNGVSQAIPFLASEAEQICDELPVAEVQKTCHETFLKYGPEIVQIGQSAVNWLEDHIPFVHCNHQQFVVQAIGNVLRSDPCEICETLLGDLSTLISQKWIQQGLKVILNKACTLLPDQKNADACSQTVNNYIDKITAFINNKVLAPEKCKTLLHCDLIDHSRDFSICDALTTIYTDIPKIVDEAEEVCDEIPVVELQQTCHDTFAKYKPQVNQIAQSAVKWISGHIPFVHCDLPEVSFVQPHPAVFRSSPCKICDTVIGDLAALINQKWIQDQIKPVLSAACGLIPDKKYADSCSQTVNNYIEKITEFIGDKILTPDNCVKIIHCDLIDSTRDFSVCNALLTIYGDMTILVSQSEAICDELPVVEVQQTCHETFQKFSPQVIQIGQNAIEWLGNHIPFVHCQWPQFMAVGQVLRSDPCGICETMLGDLSTLINEKWIEKGLQVVLNKACGLLPNKKNSDACSETIENYIEKITGFIDRDVLNPANCKTIFHCDVLDSSRDFSICDTLGDIYSEIPDIVDHAEEVCDEIPVVELQQTCHDTFAKYKPQVDQIGQSAILWITDHIPFVHCNIPDHVNFTRQPDSNFKAAKLSVVTMSLRTDPCAICKKFVGELSGFINQKWIQQGLKVFLSKACSFIPNKNNSDACSLTVNNYIEKITDFIRNKVLAPEKCETLLHCDLIDHSRDFSICDTLSTIYDDIPKIVTEAEEVCDELPVVELQQSCHDTFAKYKPQVDQIAQNAVKWISDHIPFVHCTIAE